MKKEIHPEDGNQVTCSCGNSFTTKSTLGEDLSIEVCSACHPFYGPTKIVDTAGRVDKFRKRFGINSKIYSLCINHGRKVTLQKNTQTVVSETKDASVGPSVIDLKNLYQDTGYLPSILIFNHCKLRKRHYIY